MEITKNKKAHFDYEILERQEAGIKLLGHELKSIRAKNVNLKGSYVSVKNNELFLMQAHIGAWKALANSLILDTSMPRKILLSRKKILYFDTKLKQGGYTLLVLRLYFKGSLVKAEVALAKGKKKHQKRQTLKERTLDKEAQKMLKKNY